MLPYTCWKIEIDDQDKCDATGDFIAKVPTFSFENPNAATERIFINDWTFTDEGESPQPAPSKPAPVSMYTAFMSCFQEAPKDVEYTEQTTPRYKFSIHGNCRVGREDRRDISVTYYVPDAATKAQCLKQLQKKISLREQQ